jgi:hypothetical protein
MRRQRNWLPFVEPIDDAAPSGHSPGGPIRQERKRWPARCRRVAPAALTPRDRDRPATYLLEELIRPERPVVFTAPSADPFSRRWRSPDYVCANSPASSPAGPSDSPAGCTRVACPPTCGSGWNHRRQILHGFFRASGIVMIHRGHHWRLGRSGQTGWITFGECGGRLLASAQGGRLLTQIVGATGLEL